MNKNHHGYIVTSPTGSVSLLDLPVPVHESHEKACKWGRQQGKPFVVTTASKFYATPFGKQVRALTHKKLSTASKPLHLNPDDGYVYGEMVLTSEERERLPKAPTSLTNLLNRIKANAQDRRLNTKIADDTRRRKIVADPIAKQMRTVGETLDATRERLASEIPTPKVVIPSGVARASNEDFMSLWGNQDARTRLEIDQASKMFWDKRRVNKLVKLSEGPPTPKSIKAILILFRAGKLPERVRTYKRILKLVNK